MSQRENFRYFQSIPTRWADNDIYGHVNNVIYYSFFDTAINSFLIAEGAFELHAGPAIGVCAESHCKYLGSLAFPGTIDAGLCVEHLGRSSVRYGLGLFRSGEPQAAATGWFVHVFVDRETRRPVEIPASLRAALEGIRVQR